MLEEEKETKKTHSTKQRRAIRRFTFSYILILSIVLFLMILQIIFSKPLQNFDIGNVKKFQALFPRVLYDNGVFQFFAKGLYYYTDFYILNGFLCFLYSAFNPFLSFKIALLSNFAICLHTISILLVYREPRPYWVASGVKMIACDATFTGPSYNQFMATFLMLYFIIELKKYQIFQRRFLEPFFIGIFVYLAFMTLAFNLICGHHFLYQNAVGVVSAVIVVILANAFDNSISILVLKVGFFHKSSRKYKFMLLVALLLLFSVCMVFALIIEAKTLLEPEWILNYKAECGSGDISNAYDNTKVNLASVTFLIGMTFGGPLSNERIPLYWWKSKYILRAARGIISLLAYSAVIILFGILLHNP
eukprot:TRINITY_DN14591_c0_g2_i1.p1 TRINITY_DN14591_c0_g2~~TRINITY_DN14591_c0_g2_i1.p1  ORF type:complete len:362 (-),score=73.24 TRINITY_DN14591_c0_g2_i1:161-1246(-)